MVILKEAKKQEGTPTLQQALNTMANTFSRGVIVKYRSRLMNFTVSASWFDYDPEDSKQSVIQASIKGFGELIVYPEQIKKIENYISGFRFTLSDGAVIETLRN